jgi:hypothetical protein
LLLTWPAFSERDQRVFVRPDNTPRMDERLLANQKSRVERNFYFHIWVQVLSERPLENTRVLAERPSLVNQSLEVIS